MKPAKSTPAIGTSVRYACAYPRRCRDRFGQPLRSDPTRIIMGSKAQPCSGPGKGFVVGIRVRSGANFNWSAQQSTQWLQPDMMTVRMVPKDLNLRDKVHGATSGPAFGQAAVGEAITRRDVVPIPTSVVGV